LTENSFVNIFFFFDRTILKYGVTVTTKLPKLRLIQTTHKIDTLADVTTEGEDGSFGGGWLSKIIPRVK
jgi:hypothetical protein